MSHDFGIENLPLELCALNFCEPTAITLIMIIIIIITITMIIAMLILIVMIMSISMI